ncbi:MAG: phytochelatin synthase family protein [Bacteriovoracales bacterium]
MKSFKLVLFSSIFTFLFVSQLTYANQELIPENLVSINSLTGQEIFKRAQLKPNYEELARFFSPQPNPFFCGPTSASIIINSIRMSKYMTPESFFTQKVELIKTNSQVMDPKGDAGFTLDQFYRALQAHNLNVKKTEVLPELSDQNIINDLMNTIQTKGKYIIVNFFRAGIGEKGGGHFSPLGAYDRISDSFLLMDVNPKKYPWVWVKTKDLIKGMRTLDKNHYRGFVVVF